MLTCHFLFLYPSPLYLLSLSFDVGNAVNGKHGFCHCVYLIAIKYDSGKMTFLVFEFLALDSFDVQVFVNQLF